MHSSFLRGSDFQLWCDGQAVSHTDFFADLTATDRLGVFAPNGVDGVGAATLILAHVTAFYDRYREQASEFFAYPDYYSFQSCQPLADYAMFDIWPTHKNVYVAPDAVSRLDAINDRAINILVVPDKEPAESSYQPAQLESARRVVRHCYAYSTTDLVVAPTLKISTENDAIFEWVPSIFERGNLADDPNRSAQKSAWLAQHRDGILRQSFRTISLDEALRLL